MLDTLARALRLDETERSHLYHLARHRPERRRRPRPERVRTGVRLMIEAFGDVPALVIGRCTAVLARNRAAHATELIGELTLNSAEFAALWAAHHVRACVPPTRSFRHPVAGAMTLHTELMELPQDDGQRLAVFTAAPGPRMRPRCASSPPPAPGARRLRPMRNRPAR